MLEQFKEYITTHNLVQGSGPVLAAVSGGIDSVALVHLLNEAAIPFAIAHCNFGLRGEESEADEQFVKKLAKKYKVPYYVQHFETQAFADQEGISIQMAARELRYAWFTSLVREHGFEALATAHHRNDLAETILLNLTRGTGIAGMHGILPKQGHVIRPMLFMDKDDIMSIVHGRQLAWREDSSNESVKYQRNFLRHEVLPLLKKLNPNLEQTLEQTAQKVSAVENWFAASMLALRPNLVKEDGKLTYIDIDTLKAQQEAKLVLYEVISGFGFNYSQAGQIIEALDGEPGKLFHAPAYTLLKDRQKLLITPKDLQAFAGLDIAENITALDAGSFKLVFNQLNTAEHAIDTSRKVACLNLDSLDFPLQLRNWKEGDWFVPLGMNQKKKLSDFLTDEKVPLTLKKDIKVITSGGNIIWVVGKRIDNRYKVTEESTRMLKIEIK
jgi:tRNA(Ile)-lysidine synthase